MNEFPFHHEHGWIGGFTRKQAPGAIPNGAIIVKTAEDVGDTTPLGTLGTVLGSHSHPRVGKGETLYFVEWANRPRCAVAVIAWKIEKAP
jgi:hypothetical protein